MHFHLYQAVSLACLAAPALDIETEPAGLVPPRLSFRKPGEKVPDLCKNAGIGRGIGPGRPADRALVNIDNFIDILSPPDLFMLSRDAFCPVDAFGKGHVLEYRLQGWIFPNRLLP